MKKMIAIILETVFLLLSILPSIAVATKQPTEMEALDVVIAAYMFAGSIDSVTNNSDEAVFVTDIVPLYDFEKKLLHIISHFHQIVMRLLSTIKTTRQLSSLERA